MINIVIGTTPTIKFTFNIVDPADITAAVMTIKYNGEIIIEKALADAAVGEHDISWILSQSDTLLLPVRRKECRCPAATIMVNWLLADGTRGSSAERDLWGIPNHKAEVMTNGA